MVFAPSVVEVVMLSSDEEIPDEEVTNEPIVVEEDDHASQKKKGKMVDISSLFHSKNRSHPKLHGHSKRDLRSYNNPMHVDVDDGGPSNNLLFMHCSSFHGPLNVPPVVHKPSNLAPKNLNPTHHSTRSLRYGSCFTGPN